MLKKLWTDPVWSKVISAAIISACASACTLAISLLPTPHTSFSDGVSTALDLAGRAAWLLTAFVACWLLVLAAFRLRAGDKAAIAPAAKQHCGANVYRDIGKWLEGQWSVSYDVNFDEKPPRTVGSSRTVSCYVSKNTLERLELRLNMKDDPLHTAVEEVVIRNVALRYNEAGGVTMFYYYQGTMPIWPHIAQSIVSDSGSGRSDQVTVEYFGLLSFDKPTEDRPVKEMKGTWYDLNGNIARLLILLDAKNTAYIKELPFEPVRLSQVRQNGLTAKMGRVEFNRQ